MKWTPSRASLNLSFRHASLAAGAVSNNRQERIQSGIPLLDACERRWIQELSGMNLFAVIGGELHTPELDGAILPGVTRDSLLTLCPHMGYTVVERRMALDELLAQVENGECSEIFACGTAATVGPIGALVDRTSREYVPRRVDVVAAKLREALLAIQERRAPDPFGWTRDVAAFAG